MQYKRILVSCLIVILMLCTAMTTVGAADQTAPLEFAVGVTSSTAISEEPFVLEAGDSFEVSISIDKNPGISGFEIWIEYNSEVLTLNKTGEDISFTKGEVGKDLDIIVEQKKVNVVKFVYIGDDNFTGTGKLATVKFTVNESFHGNIDLKVVRSEAMNKANDLFYPPVNTKVGTVEVHEFSSEWTEDVKAGCTTEGSKSRHCVTEGCTAKAEVTPIPATGHAIGDWIVEKEATCTEAGSKHHVCGTCQEKLDVTAIEATGHTVVEYEDVDPTKETVGYYGGKYCSVCNEVLEERTELPKIADYTWIYILVAIVVVVAIGGGICAYFFIFKKKNAR